MLHYALFSLAISTASATSGDSASMLAAVPPDAFVLVHCHDLAGLNERAARNDWVRMLGSEDGDPLYASLASGFLDATHTELDELLAIARSVHGEGVLFAGLGSAGFVTTPPPDRAGLTQAMRNWLPGDDEGGRKTIVLSGARVELAAWDGATELGGWTGRNGHFAALVDHPRLLGLFSGNTADVVIEGLTTSLAGLDAGIEPALAAAYRESGGGASGGIELYIDYTPLAASAEQALRSIVRDMVPNPASMLGLDRGIWLHATADIFPGTRIDSRARLHLPADSVVMQLASTFRPLPHSLPADLPSGVQALWALRWDLAEFYSTARKALSEGGGEAGLQVIDQGLTAAEGLTGVDPIEDVIEQLEGTFAFYALDGPREDNPYASAGRFGFLAHLVDGEAFFEAFDQLVSGVGEAFEHVELEGMDAYMFGSDPEVDGGVAFLPNAFVGAPARATLVRAMHALSGADGTSLVDGSPMQAAIDENAGATFLTVVDLSSYRDLVIGAHRSSEAVESTVNPFDSQLIGSVRPVPDGFEFKLVTQ